MQCNSTRFTTGTLLNFLGFIKNYPACRPAACKKFQQSQLRSEVCQDAPEASVTQNQVVRKWSMKCNKVNGEFFDGIHVNDYRVSPVIKLLHQFAPQHAGNLRVKTKCSRRWRSGNVFSFNSNSRSCIVILQNVSMQAPGIFHVL